MSAFPAAPSAGRTTMFAVNTAGETVADSWENENVNGEMPEALRARVETLNKRFGEDGEKCQRREAAAAANHKENIENVRRTAAQHTAKAMRAAKTRAAFGENMELMGNVMGNTEKAIKLPKALDSRIAKLAPSPNKTTAAALSSKQEKAAKNRAAALRAKADKAARANEKGRIARERKAKAQREAVAAASGGRIFEVDVGKSDEAVGDERKGGWGVKTPLPPRLAQRLKKVQAKFDYDVMARYNRNADNHSAKVEAIRAKAAVASERVARAAQRRALAKGDDNHFTVTLSKEEEEATPAAGWAAKPVMPQRLQARADTLSARFAGIADTFSFEDKQARAAANRAAFNNKKKAVARQFGAEVIEKAKTRRALAAGDANHFTVTEASFNANASADGEMTSAYGWGRQQGTKLPAALLDRLDEIAKSKSEKPDMETRQAAAAAKRAALQSAATFRAAGFGSDAVAASATRRALTKGDANHFTVTFDESTESTTGWSTRPAMPRKLMTRVQTLQKKFATTTSAAERQAAAAANRAAFQRDVAAKAAEETEKVLNAQSRKLIAQGAEGQIFSVSADGDSAPTTGWGAAKPLPAHLTQRLAKLKKLAPAPHAERQAKATANRAAFQRDVAAKAAEETEKVLNAQSRKQLAAGDANTFTVNLNAQDNEPQTTGWGRQSNRLPARLAERLASLKKFAPAPHAERQAVATANRMALKATVSAKAAEESDKIANAANRRALAEGDATHFTVDFADKESDDNVEVRGWGFKPSMPVKLQKRLAKLQKQHKPKDYAVRAARADAKRAAFHAAISKKAAEETEKLTNARSRKNVVVGSENIFTVDAASEEAQATGWGVPTKLPSRLAARVEGLRQRFADDKSTASKQMAAAANRKAFHAAIARKAHAMSADRVIAAQSRKQLMMGSEDCFRVEFAKPVNAGGEDGAMEKKAGWGQPVSPNMPKRLAARAAQFLKQSPTRQNIAAKISRGDANRAKHTETVRAKASKTIAKMQAARARKLLNEMDAGIVLLNTAQQRQLSPVKLPKRLSERVERLTLRFGYDGAEREKRVEENRLRRISEIRAKAAAASMKITAAKERRAKINREKQLERINAVNQDRDTSFEEQPASSSMSTRRPSSCEKAKKQGCIIA